MLSALCFLIAVVLCAVNIFFEGTIRIEWLIGFVALGLFFTVFVVGPPADWRRARNG